MSTDHESGDGVHEEEAADSATDVAKGVANQPRGNGDLDEQALEAGKDRLEQAAGGH